MCVGRSRGTGIQRRLPGVAAGPIKETPVLPYMVEVPWES